MTGSSTGYPMTSSGDVLSSSIDLDMKFDHFGESNTCLENLDALRGEDRSKKQENLDTLRDIREDRSKRHVKRTSEINAGDVDCPDGLIQRSVDTNKSDDFEKDDAGKFNTFTSFNNNKTSFLNEQIWTAWFIHYL